MGVAGVFDAAHHQPGGDPILSVGEGGVGHFGDLGVGDPRSGVGILHRARVARTGVQACSGTAAMARWMARFLVITRENSALPRRQARTTARLPYAESPRTRIFPLAPPTRA